MIQTSYFANIKNLPTGLKKVSISRFSPKWADIDSIAIELAPSKELLEKYKQGLITEEEYTVIYKKETLDKLDPFSIYRRYKNSIFLCYEKDSDFCHRKLVSDWLNKFGLISFEAKRELKIFINSDNNEIVESFIKNFKDPILYKENNGEIFDFSLQTNIEKIDINSLIEYNFTNNQWSIIRN